MKSPPLLHLMPRVDRDFAECIQFIAKHPAGKPQEREDDIQRGFEEICSRPRANRVHRRARGTRVDLRRYAAAQFVIVYAYFPPNDQCPGGIVSIRAIRHRRVRDVFEGVKEQETPYGKPADAGG